MFVWWRCDIMGKWEEDISNKDFQSNFGKFYVLSNAISLDEFLFALNYSEFATWSSYQLLLSLIKYWIEITNGENGRKNIQGKFRTFRINQ